MRLVNSGCRTVFPLGWVGTSCVWGAYVTRRDDYAQYPVSQAISYWCDTLLSTPHVASFGSDSPVAATFARPLRAFRRWLLRPLRPNFLDIKPSGLVTGAETSTVVFTRLTARLSAAQSVALTP